MSAQQPRIFTCTPFAFHANGSFFGRDTGLICKSLQALGAESRVVMPLPHYEDDLEDAPLLRVEMRQLRSAAWWRAQRLDGVILYSWGDPRYTGVARAIHRAGVRLVIHYDANSELHEHLKRPGGALKRALNRVKDVLVNRLRARHLGYADIVTTSPPVIQAIRHDLYYGAPIANKCQGIPCPVSSVFRYQPGTRKERLMLAVGNWENVGPKRPEMLTAALEEYYANTPPQLYCRTEIYGVATKYLNDWYANLPPEVRAHITLAGIAAPQQLEKAYNRARFIICPSRSESSHIASAEALCCGCTVVCPNRPVMLVTVMWYTSEGSGTVAEEDTPAALAAAMAAESSAWDSGLRDPQRIAATWQPRVQVPYTLPRLFPVLNGR